MSDSWVVDQEYLAVLERKLKVLKDPKKTTAKQVVSDIAARKEHQFLNLLTSPQDTSNSVETSIAGFDDNFVDLPIQPNYLRLKLAPQTCAVSQSELLKLTKFDLNQKIHESSAQSEEQTEPKEVADKTVSESDKSAATKDKVD
ncbi:hypothetical protein WR25_19530 [Diploscapter pachys]|uniref:Uncharacterized protein n=1 Tax=Diploscapter pachys TaxID=2018661 RepID=A0A2A2M1F2_9BILA|nr:hypothetical protein WR25_19530 [Diploscapter pachys]